MYITLVPFSFMPCITSFLCSLLPNLCQDPTLKSHSLPEWIAIYPLDSIASVMPVVLITKTGTRFLEISQMNDTA